MCIIAYSPKGADLPDLETLRTCWENNSDGAGFAWLNADKNWEIRKGFMFWDDFKANWQKCRKENKLTFASEVVFHFRIGTSGGMTAAETHPFPITKNVKRVRKLQQTTPYMMAHNGILDAGDPKRGLSDTQVFVLEFLSHIRDLIADERIVDLITDQTVGNRLIIAKRDHIALFGDWEKDKKTGIWYSNSGWQWVFRPVRGHKYSRTNYKTDKKKGKVVELTSTVSDDSPGWNLKEIWPCPICGEDKDLQPLEPTDDEKRQGWTPIECGDCGSLYDNTYGCVIEYGDGYWDYIEADKDDIPF
jgi:predicted glutamine amidotransferase